MNVPFFRPTILDAEVDEVIDVLRSGWLTSGPRVKRFEKDFAAAVGARHAIAVNSGTAALHLAVEALGLRPSQAVLVPTMTFAATAEVVRYQGATPILVDCDATTLNMSFEDCETKIKAFEAGDLPISLGHDPDLVGVIPVHVGGLMINPRSLESFTSRHELWAVDDAAHAFPAAWRELPSEPWRHCGENTARVSCFSFYANKTITTGEGGMAVTTDKELADRMRCMSLHGLSRDAWNRYEAGGSWDYRIVAPGFKYNTTDIAAAIGLHQLARAEEMRRERESIARRYFELLSDVSEIELPPFPENRIHAWHLFPVKLSLNRFSIGRDQFIDELAKRGVGCSVHWRPLHLHPYYQKTYDWKPSHFPVASEVWRRLVTLPLFPSMNDSEIEHVVTTVKDVCRRNRKYSAMG